MNTRTITTGLRVTVQPWERAVVLRSGVIARSTQAGRYFRRRGEHWLMIDARPQWLTLATQEVLTADGLQVRATPVAQYRVADPVTWLTASADPLTALYTRAQLALRDALTGKPLDEVLRARGALLEGARAELAEAVAAFGAELLAFDLRDVMLPQELRAAYSETARAKEEGRAKLERARADAAALRSMANAASVLEAHPALLELKAIESAGFGSKLIMHIGDSAAPIVVD